MTDHDPDVLLPDDVVASRYRVQWLIGKGGVGAVYGAIDTHNEQPVALKVLLDRFAHTPQVRQRFAREADVAMALKHPGIVQVRDRGVHDNKLFLVMERLVGASLAERLIDEPQLPLATAAAIGTQLGAAMAYAHAQNVFHRDLKPGNLFVSTEDSERGRLRVLDFGLAKIDSTINLTDTNDVFGTLEYMPPEQVASSKHASAPADVYAMGAILFEMLSGRCPLEAATQVLLTSKILYAVPDPIRSVRPDVPEAVNALIASCLDKNAAARPTAQTFADVLSPYASRSILPTRPASPNTPPPNVAGVQMAAVKFISDPPPASTRPPAPETKPLGSQWPSGKKE